MEILQKDSNPIRSLSRAETKKLCSTTFSTLTGPGATFSIEVFLSEL